MWNVRTVAWFLDCTRVVKQSQIQIQSATNESRRAAKKGFASASLVPMLEECLASQSHFTHGDELGTSGEFLQPLRFRRNRFKATRRAAS